MIRLDAGLIDASARAARSVDAIEISVQVDHERRRQRRRQCRQPLVGEAPDRVRDLDTDPAEPLRQRVERMGDMRRVHVGAAATFGLSTRRIGSDHGDTTQIADAQRQCRRIARQCSHNLIPQQHHAFGSSPAHEHPVLRQVARSARARAGHRRTHPAASSPTTRCAPSDVHRRPTPRRRRRHRRGACRGATSGPASRDHIRRSLLRPWSAGRTNRSSRVHRNPTRRAARSSIMATLSAAH